MIVTDNGYDTCCEHGVAVDVHCCGCHSGFIFDRDHVCFADEYSEERSMNINTGEVYESYEAAKKAGVPDELLVTGTRPAIDALRTKLKFTKGSFKRVDRPQAESK